MELTEDNVKYLVGFLAGVMVMFIGLVYKANVLHEEINLLTRTMQYQHNISPEQIKASIEAERVREGR